MSNPHPLTTTIARQVSYGERGLTGSGSSQRLALSTQPRLL
jgi:hypothetical protein